MERCSSEVSCVMRPIFAQRILRDLRDILPIDDDAAAFHVVKA